MSDGARLRLVVLRVLVVALLATLGVRLAYLQVFDSNKLVQTANRQHTREVVLPAPRGAIVDDQGRPLADNRTALVIAVDGTALNRQQDKGAAVLARLGSLLRVSASQLRHQITPCTKGVPKPCWTGSPVQPVPVATSASEGAVLRISEHREDYPAVIVDSQPVRQYPSHTLAGHELGYIGAVSQQEIDAAASSGHQLHDEDTVGRSGLEASYDSRLRGDDGVRTVSVDNTGAVTGTVSTKAPTPGDTLVTSLNSTVQSLAQQALNRELISSRKAYDAKNHENYAAPSGAVVAMDPMTGRILAIASHPNYDPNVFVGGISQSALNALTSTQAGTPLVSRAIQGQYAPGSTFKLSTASAIVMDGQLGLDQTGACPPSLKVGNQQKTNYDSESLGGTITLQRALAFSCDTFFYRYAMGAWYADQKRVKDHQKPAEALQSMAQQFGFGGEPGIDLPSGEQTAGQIVTRAFLKQRWDQLKGQYCTNAKKGYPTVGDATRRAYLTELAKENCTDGYRYRIGEAADLAIGQGETTVSPLQLALAYSALVNGGKLYEPTLGKAIVDPQGKVVQQITPKVRRTVPVRPDVLAYIRNALKFGSGGVSGENAFAGFPFKRFPVSGKTGTAEVYGKEDTSWFASWSRAGTQNYVIVGMVEQAGTGARAAAPMVRQVYNGIYGVGAHKKPAEAGARMPSTLPTIAPYADTAPPGDLVGPDQPLSTATPTGIPAALAPNRERWRGGGRSG